MRRTAWGMAPVNRKRACLRGVAALLAAGLGSLHAQTTYTYSTSTTGVTWLTPGNWTVAGSTSTKFPGDATGTVANEGASNDIAAFGATASTGAILINFNTAGGGLAVGTIDLLSSANKAISIGDNVTTSGILTLTGNALNGVANTILSNESTFNLSLVPTQTSTGVMTVALGNAAANVVQVNGTGNIAVSSVIQNGAGNSLTLTGTGTGALTLSGANTFTGGVTVGAGNTLNINNAGTSATNSALGTGTLLLNGGTLDNTASSTLATLATNNAQTWNGDFAFKGTYNLNLGAGAVSLGTSAGAARTVTVTANTLTVGGVISDGTNATTPTTALLKSGAGTLALGGVNTFTGGVTVGNGTLSVATVGNSGANSNLGTNGTINLGSTTTTGVLTYTGVGETSDKILNLNGTTGGATITQSGTGALKFTSDLTATGVGLKTLTLQGSTAAATGEISGKIVDSSSGATSLVKAGTGTWTLSGANTYTGLTDVQGGTLAYGIDNVIADAASVKVSGGTLSLTTFSDTVAGVQLTGGSVTGTTGVLTSTSAYDLQNGSVSAILGGSVAANKTAAGTVTLSGANTFSGGLNLSAGLLALGTNSTVSGGVVTSGPVGTGLLTISTGATLRSSAATTGGDRTLNNNLSLSGAITLGNATTNGVLTFDNTGLSAPSAVLTAATTLTVNSAVNIADVISGGFGLAKAGSGTLTLSGANTYTGLTDVQLGTLAYGANNVIADAASLGVSGGTLSLTTFSDTVAGVQLTGGGSITGTTGVLTSTSAYDLQSGSVSAILGGSVAANKTTSNTVTLSGANTYTGGTTLSAGTLALGASSTVASGAVTSGPVGTGLLTIGTGATLASNAATPTGDRTLNNNLSLSGTITLGNATSTGVLTFDNRTLTSPSAVLTADTTLNTSSSNAVVYDVLSGTGRSLTKGGLGVLTLGSVNTYDGATTAVGGTLRLGVSGALVNTTALTVGIASGTSLLTTFDLAGFSQTVGSLQFFGGNGSATSSSVTLNGGVLTVNGGVGFGLADGSRFPATITGTGTSALDLGGAVRTFTIYNHINSAGDLQVSSVIQNGGITKTQGGVLTLSGANTYALGTTVSGGTIALGSSSVVAGNAITSGPVGTGTLTLATGSALSSNAATTGGDRTLNNNLSLSGAIALGNSSNTGVLTFDNRALTSPGAVLTADTVLTVNSGVLIYDVLSGTGRSLSKAGSGTLELAAINTFSGGYTNSAGVTYLDVNGTLGSVASVLVSGGSLVSGFTNRTDLINDAAAVSTSGAGAIDISGGTETIGSLAGSSSATTGLLIGDYTNTTTSTTYSGSLTVGGNNTDTTYSGVIGGVRAAAGALLTKVGTGTLTLSGANTFTGSVLVSTGTLKLGAAGGATNTPLGTTAAGTTVGGTGAALDLGGFTLGTAEPLTLNGTGISSGGALTNSATTAATYSGLVTLGSSSSIVSGSGSSANILLTNTGTITGPGYGLTLGGSSTGSSVTSVIGTGTGTLTKTGSGTWTILGATSNTYTGLTTVSQGTLALGKTVASTNAVGGDLTINGGTVNYSSTVNEQIPNTSNVTLSSGTFDLAARTETINSLAMSGGALNKASTALTLSAASSITGGTVTFSVTASQLNANGALALGGATFSYTNASNPSSGAGLVLGANVSYASTNTAATVFSNTLAGVGRLDLGGATRTFDIAAASPALANAAPEVQVGWNVTNGGLTKQGTGTLALSAGNSYAGGTLVSAGSLLVSNANGTSATGTGAVTVSTTGTLLGTGYINAGANNVTINGTLSPGPGTTNNAGTINVASTAGTGALTLSSGSKLAFDIYSTMSKDLVALGNSTLTVDGATLALTLSDSSFGSTLYNSTYTLISGVSALTPGSGFASITGYDSADYVAQVNLNGTNYDLSFTPVPVPEPATVLGGLLTAGLFGYRQRRRLRGLFGACR